MENLLRSSSLIARGPVIDEQDLGLHRIQSQAETQIEELLELDFRSAVGRLERVQLK
jgi:hypothetical protein